MKRGACFTLLLVAAFCIVSRAVQVQAGAKFCRSDADCGSSYCMDFAPHKPPFICHYTPPEDQPTPPSTQPTSGSSSGSPTVNGKTCETDADCPQSYCLNWAPHLKPYLCHDSDFPFCSDPTLRCQHMGDLYEVSCQETTDCPSGSYCLNYAPHIPPYVCHANDAPVCKCACVGGWEGPTCDVFNSGSSSGPAINKFAAVCAAEEQAELSKQQAEFNPFTGFLGQGYDATTGTMKLPALALGFEDASKTFQGRRMPSSSTFTDLTAGAGVQPVVENVQNFAQLRTAVEANRQHMSSAQVPLFGVYEATGLTTEFADFFKTDKALGVVRQEFPRYQMSLTTDTPVVMMQGLSDYVESLPDTASTAMEQQAYEAVITNWGTHYFTSTTLGGLIEYRTSYEWWLNNMPTWWPHMTAADLSNQMLADFTTVAKVTPTGQPASAGAISGAATTLNGFGGLFKANSQLQPLSCTGGDAAEDCNSGDLSKWFQSLNPNSVAPVRGQLLPISNLLPAGSPKRTILESMINAKLAAQSATWNAQTSCPACSRGSCGGTADHCTCPNADHTYGRTCDECKSGWEGSTCAAPICEGCNTAHATCTAPGSCTCHSCYAGHDCTEYTCGCFDAQSTVVLASSNASIPIADVRQGDLVLAVDAASGEVVASEVYYTRLNNGDGSGKVPMVELAVEGEGQAPLRLTEEHLVYATAAWTPSASFAGATEVMARDVAVGNYLWVRASNGLVLRRVLSKSVSLETRPVVSVYTLAGPVLVDGVVASSYEWNSMWQRLEALEARTLYKLAPSIAKSDWYRAHVDWWDDYVTEPLQPLWRAVSAATSKAGEWTTAAAVDAAMLFTS